jgi:hypothetical protein
MRSILLPSGDFASITGHSETTHLADKRAINKCGNQILYQCGVNAAILGVSATRKSSRNGLLGDEMRGLLRISWTVSGRSHTMLANAHEPGSGHCVRQNS